MTPSETLLHDIASSFARLPGAIDRATIYQECCAVCGGSGRCAVSRWDAPQLHVERCVGCSGRGYVVREWGP